MKKIAATILCLGILASTCSVALSAAPEVYYNGRPLILPQPAVIQDGRTLLALRDIAEQMDVDVQWDRATRLATIIYNDKTITLQPDLQRVLIDGTAQQVEVGPQMIADRIYLPVRYLFELLDADVFYRSYEDGQTVISVNSRDSYINYVTTTGRLTKAIRHVNSDKTDNPVIMTRDGNILEIVSNDGKIDLYRTTQTFSRAEKQTEDTAFHKQVTDIIEDNGQYFAVLDVVQSPRCIGNGYRRNGPAILEELDTPQGRFAFFGSEATINTLALESNDGFVSKTVQGYLLDISGSNKTIQDSSYVFTEHGGYGFLTDGQLLLLGNVPAKGFQVLSCNTISETMRTGKLFAQGSHFYVIGADTAENGKQELFVTAYNGQGQKVHPYAAVSHLSDTENYRYLKIADAVQVGDKAYLLLQTNYNRYLACYDLVSQSFTSEKLNLPFEKFVEAKDSWQLFYCDEDDYYFLQLQ